MNIISLFVLIFLVTVGAMVFIFLFVIFKKEEDPQDQTIFWHFLPQYTNGYVEGVVQKIVKGPKRTAIIFSPRDVNYLRLSKLKIKTKIENEKIFIENNKLKFYPKGVWSNERNILIGFPYLPESIPNLMKEDDLGKTFMKFIEETNLKNTELDILRESNSRMEYLARDRALGVISGKDLQFLDARQKEMLKLVASGKEDKRVTSFTPGTSEQKY